MKYSYHARLFFVSSFHQIQMKNNEKKKHFRSVTRMKKNDLFWFSFSFCLVFFLLSYQIHSICAMKLNWCEVNGETRHLSVDRLLMLMLQSGSTASAMTTANGMASAERSFEQLRKGRKII